MKISNANLDRLTRWELQGLLKDVLKHAESHTDGMPELYTNKLDELRTVYDAYDDVLAQEEKASIDSLIAAEEGRDHAVRKMYALIKEYANFPYEEAKEDAAKQLLRLFKPYGTGNSIASMSQDEETMVLTNLFQDIDKSEETENCIATLGLSIVADNLRSYNSIFNELQHNRYIAETQFVAGVVKDARIALQKEFMSYADVVNALTIVEGEEKYTELKQTVNLLVKKYVDKAKQRTKKKEEETEPEVIE